MQSIHVQAYVVYTIQLYIHTYIFLVVVTRIRNYNAIVKSIRWTNYKILAPYNRYGYFGHKRCTLLFVYFDYIITHH